MSNGLRGDICECAERSRMRRRERWEECYKGDVGWIL